MPRKRTKNRDIIEQDFFDALERLESGRPQNPDLRARLKNGKVVKVNISNVAKEAGRSRVLIGQEDCRYPIARNRILDASGQEGRQPGNLADVIKQLRASVAELRAELKEVRAHAAWHLVERQKAEKLAQRYKSELERRRLSASRDGKVLSFYEGDGKFES